MKFVYYLHGMFCYLLFSLAGQLDQMMIMGEIASEKRAFLDDIDPDELDKLVIKKLENE